MKVYAKDVTERARAAVEHVKNSTEPKTYYRVMAEVMGLQEEMISDMMSGRREANPVLLSGLHVNYGISARWLLSGEGDMMDGRTVKEAVAGSKMTLSDALDELELTKRRLADALDMIKTLVR